MIATAVTKGVLNSVRNACLIVPTKASTGRTVALRGPSLRARRRLVHRRFEFNLATPWPASHARREKNRLFPTDRAAGSFSLTARARAGRAFTRHLPRQSG